MGDIGALALVEILTLLSGGFHSSPNVILNTSFIVTILISSHLLVSFGRHHPHILHFKVLYIHMDSFV